MKQLVTWQGANSYQTKENDSIEPNGRIPGVCPAPTYKGRHLKRKGLDPGQTRSGDYFWNLSQWGWKEKENHYWEETGSELKSQNQGKGKDGRTSEKAGGQDRGAGTGPQSVVQCEARHDGTVGTHVLQSVHSVKSTGMS